MHIVNAEIISTCFFRFFFLLSLLFLCINHVGLDNVVSRSINLFNDQLDHKCWNLVPMWCIDLTRSTCVHYLWTSLMICWSRFFEFSFTMIFGSWVLGFCFTMICRLSGIILHSHYKLILGLNYRTDSVRCILMRQLDHSAQYFISNSIPVNNFRVWH